MLLFAYMYNFQVLFIKWVLTMFDMIDAKDQLRAIYGFIFSFVTEENLVFVLMSFTFFIIRCLVKSYLHTIQLLCLRAIHAGLTKLICVLNGCTV